MTEVKLGPAGSCGQGNLKGVKFVKEKGLHAMEVEFTYGVRMKEKLAKQVGKSAKELGIELSVHAPYWINLNSREKKKVEESKERILRACQRGNWMGAKNIVFHPGFYMNMDKESVYRTIKKGITEVQKAVKSKSWDVVLTPETTGKKSQFGSLEELARLRDELDLGICVDFAHLLARKGDPESRNDYRSILKKMDGHIHSHFSGIEYTEKGEKRHVNMDGRPAFKSLAEEVLKQGKDITIICESPVTWKDSLKMKKVFEELGYKFK